MTSLHILNNRHLRAHLLLNIKNCMEDQKPHFEIRNLSTPSPLKFFTNLQTLIDTHFKNSKKLREHLSKSNSKILKINIEIHTPQWLRLLKYAYTCSKLYGCEWVCVSFIVESNFNHTYTHIHTQHFNHTNTNTQT